MTCKNYLDYCIENYYSKILKNNFSLISSNDTDSFAVNIYRGDFYILKVLCDRGVIETEISSVYNMDRFIYIDDLYIHVKLLQSEEIKLSSWDLKMITSKHLTSEEQVNFLNDNSALIANLLNKDNCEKTFRDIINSAYKKHSYQKWDN
jgi:hypothetical protein